MCLDISLDAIDFSSPPVAIDNDFFGPTSTSRGQPVTATQQAMRTEQDSTLPLAVAIPIDSKSAATQRSNNKKCSDSQKAIMCSAIIVLVIIFTIVIAMLVDGTSTPDYTTTPTDTVSYYDSFEAFCFSVMGFYGLEKPWLKCRCDHDSYWIECQGTRPIQDSSFSPIDSGLNNTSLDSSTNFNNTDDATVRPNDAPFTVVMFQYSNVDDADQIVYTGTSCECATQSCDPDTTVCFELNRYDDSSDCRITNYVAWGDSICTVFGVEQDIFGEEYSTFHDACQLCGGLPQTDDATDSDSGYYYFDTSGCGSDFNHGNNSSNNNMDPNYCVLSLIPNQALLYGAMTTAAHHTPNQQLLNSMQTSNAFCNYMTNKYENEIGGYTCTCTEEDYNNTNNSLGNYLGDIINTVECRQAINDTMNYVRWQRLYWPYDVNSFEEPIGWSATSSRVAPLTYPFQLLGESCQCSEPTCTVSPVLCTALSYNFERYGCSVYDKLNATPADDDDDGALLCGSQECSICELSPGDERHRHGPSGHQFL
ncbi:hypothetical protein IV203_021644 [Nitzschia inconspicua]|uniref:Uncharacterized protein n=1 Tax=Nitzschia inconspicua TaxID=303405 RepID=A0A9K3KI22_9STRA|nr:hypothetical protein IV203_021644 [Nitzschia inconspicua]